MTEIEFWVFLLSCAIIYQSVIYGQIIATMFYCASKLPSKILDLTSNEFMSEEENLSLLAFPLIQTHFLISLALFLLLFTPLPLFSSSWLCHKVWLWVRYPSLCHPNYEAHTHFKCLLLVKTYSEMHFFFFFLLLLNFMLRK